MAEGELGIAAVAGDGAFLAIVIFSLTLFLFPLLTWKRKKAGHCRRRRRPRLLLLHYHCPHPGIKILLKDKKWSERKNFREDLDLKKVSLVDVAMEKTRKRHK